jgi:hypothetical protein
MGVGTRGRSNCPDRRRTLNPSLPSDLFLLVAHDPLQLPFYIIERTESALSSGRSNLIDDNVSPCLVVGWGRCTAYRHRKASCRSGQGRDRRRSYYATAVLQGLEHSPFDAGPCSEVGAGAQQIACLSDLLGTGERHDDRTQESEHDK